MRLLVFALLAHLEELMRASICQTQPNDELAIRGLELARLKAVRKTLKLQNRKGLNLSRLDVTQFIDKVELLFALGLVEEEPGDRALFDSFYELRNKVDHVDQYAETLAKLAEFIRHIRELEAWIDRLANNLPGDFPAVGVRRP